MDRDGICTAGKVAVRTSRAEGVVGLVASGVIDTLADGASRTDTRSGGEMAAAKPLRHYGVGDGCAVALPEKRAASAGLFQAR